MKVRQEIFDTYWITAARRQDIFFNKINGVYPLTDDVIFQRYKFCNVYRASDRVSQYLIRNVIYDKARDEKTQLFRIFLFRLFNKCETWDYLTETLGEINLENFDQIYYSKLINKIKKEGGVVYGNAFILCANKAYGYDKKHDNHLALIDYIFRKSQVADGILRSKSLRELFLILRNLPLIGNFMAYQIATDFNYSEVFSFEENDFTVAGPGAIRGIRKCFVDTGGMSDEEIIMYMVENQDVNFERLGLNFHNLFGRKMKAIDCQNWFCETDKYCRVAFPEIKSDRVKIKAEYSPTNKPIKLFYPPKWRLDLGDQDNKKTH